MEYSCIHNHQSQFLEMLKGNSNNMCLSDISQSISKGITPKYVDQSNILVINQACVNWGSLDFSKVKYHNEDVTYTKGILHRDDILLTMTGRGTLGRCNIFNPQNQGKTYIADGHISIIRLDNEILLPELFTAYIALSDTQNEIYRNYVTGSTNQLDIVFSEIQQMPIPIPEMVRQKAYVDIVRQADKSKFDGFKSQFIEWFGNEPNMTLSDIFEIIRNGANIRQGNSTSGLPITRIETISDETVDRSKMGYADLKLGDYTSYYLEDGDILLSHINSLKHIGKCALYTRKSVETIVHGMNLLMLRPTQKVIPEFALHMLRSKNVRSQIQDITKPAVNQASFTVSDVKKIKVFIPSLEEQQRFVSIVRQADKSKYYEINET